MSKLLPNLPQFKPPNNESLNDKKSNAKKIRFRYVKGQRVELDEESSPRMRTRSPNKSLSPNKSIGGQTFNVDASKLKKSEGSPSRRQMNATSNDLKVVLGAKEE